MVKMTVFYDQPEDAAAFENYYLNTHLPQHGAKLPFATKLEANKAAGEQPLYYRTADIYFDDMASLQACLGSPIGQAAVVDLDNFAKGRYKVLITEIQPVKLAATTSV
jgi:uncharacterized protein (TIGR02118 family)